MHGWDGGNKEQVAPALPVFGFRQVLLELRFAVLELAVALPFSFKLAGQVPQLRANKRTNPRTAGSKNQRAQHPNM